MTLLTFFGRLLTAYGPSIVVLILYIGKRSTSILLSLSSALFWLVATLLTSILWYIIPGLETSQIALISISTLIQEAARYLMYITVNRAEDTLIKIEAGQTFHRLHYAIACGYGFAVMSSLIFYIDPLVASVGPAKLACKACPQMDLLFMSAIVTLLFQILHVLWGVLAFTGWHRSSWIEFGFVVISHFGASLSTLSLGWDQSSGCFLAIGIPVVLIVVTYLWNLKNVDKLKRD